MNGPLRKNFLIFFIGHIKIGPKNLHTVGFSERVGQNRWNQMYTFQIKCGLSKNVTQKTGWLNN